MKQSDEPDKNGLNRPSLDTRKSELNKIAVPVLNGDKRQLISISEANPNLILIVNKFKENPIVNESELLSYMSTLHKIDDFVLYLWCDKSNVNRMIVCVYRGPVKSEVVFCNLIDGEDKKDNHLLFKNKDVSLLNKWNICIGNDK